MVCTIQHLNAVRIIANIKNQVHPIIGMMLNFDNTATLADHSAPSGARRRKARENREGGAIPLRAQRCMDDAPATSHW